MEQNQFFPPNIQKQSYTCPHCSTFAQMDLLPLEREHIPYAGYQDADDRIILHRCLCCNEIIVWYKEELVYPNAKLAPSPNKDLSENIQRTYLEAAQIVEISPRAACALLRLALELLINNLNPTGKNLDEKIKNLVEQKKLDSDIEESLHLVRVIGNQAIHPGVLNIDDNKEIAYTLFNIINFISKTLISFKKERQNLLNSLPQNLQNKITSQSIDS